MTSGGEPLKSVYEADDNEEFDNDAEEAVIGDATVATSARPKAVRQSASGREVVGLKEILKEDPTTAKEASDVGDKSPTKSKVARFLGDNVRFGSKRGGIVGVPAAREAEDVTLVRAVETGGIIGGIQQGPSLGVGLRSNPVRRAATVPAQRSRRVTFPPPPVDVGAKQRGAGAREV